MCLKKYPAIKVDLNKYLKFAEKFNKFKYRIDRSSDWERQDLQLKTVALKN